MSTTPQIVHTLNELIAHVETQVVLISNDAHLMRDHALGEEDAMQRVMAHLDYKRALGQLKAARTSIMSASAREVAA